VEWRKGWVEGKEVEGGEAKGEGTVGRERRWGRDEKGEDGGGARVEEQGG